MSTVPVEFKRPALTVSQGFLELVCEQLATLGAITTRRLFGSMSIYRGGTIIALVRHNELYFKVDATTRPQFEIEGSSPFSYKTKTGAQIVNGYWSAPSRVFDHPSVMLEFARAALAAGRRAGGKSRTNKS